MTIIIIKTSFIIRQIQDLKNNSSSYNFFQTSKFNFDEANNSNIYSTSTKYSYLSLREENERLKISNTLLQKLNDELKTENNNLNKELEIQYQMSRNSFGNNNPMHRQSNSNLFLQKSAKKQNDNHDLDNSQNMNNFNELIESLKDSLGISKKNNEELNNLLENQIKKLAEVQKENSELKEHCTNADKDLEVLSKKFSETKELLENFKNTMENIQNENENILEEKKELESKIYLAEEQIINLISINESLFHVFSSIYSSTKFTHIPNY